MVGCRTIQTARRIEPSISDGWTGLFLEYFLGYGYMSISATGLTGTMGEFELGGSAGLQCMRFGPMDPLTLKQ